MMRVARLIVVAAIVYGSLYPFTFRTPWIQPFDGLTSVTPGDVVVNLLLYMPLGLLLTVRGGRVGKAVLAGLLLSLCVETAQLWLPARTTAIADLTTNTLGTLAGALLGRLAGRLLAARARMAAERGGDGGTLYGVFMGLAFLGWQATPFVPRLDRSAWRDSLAPLLDPAPLIPGDIVAYAAVWMAVGLVVGALRGRRVALWLLMLVALVVAAKTLVVTRAVTPEVVLTGLLVALAWALPAARRVVAAPGVVAAALAVAILWAGLAEAFPPGPATPFRWTPFYGFLGGSMLVNVQVMFEKVFLYGALVLALLRMGAPAPLTGLLTAGLLLVIEAVQAATGGGRVAEITDPLIALVLTILAAGLGEGRRYSAAGRARAVAPAQSP